LIGVYLLQGKIRAKLDEYVHLLKTGVIKKTKA